MNGALVDANLGELLDEQRVHYRRGNRRVAEDVLLDARRVDHLGIEIEQGFAIGKVEGDAGLHLAPDEHVLSSQRDLFVAIPYVGANSLQHLVLGHIELRVQIWQTELAATPAACGHLHHAKGGALAGEKDFIARLGMAHIYLPGQLLAPERLVENLHGVSRFASTFHHAIDAEFVKQIRLHHLPAARTAHDHLELIAMRIALDLRE